MSAWVLAQGIGEQDQAVLPSISDGAYQDRCRSKFPRIQGEASEDSSSNSGFRLVDLCRNLSAFQFAPEEIEILR